MYEYSKGDRLKSRNTYFYTAFHGKPFLRAWVASRAAAAVGSGDETRVNVAEPEQVDAPAETGEVETTAILTYLKSALADDAADEAARRWIDLMVQRFEVSKRVHRLYHWSPAGLRSVRGSGFRDLELYLRYAEVMARAFEVTQGLQQLNVLLKVTDTLVAAGADLSSEQTERLTTVIQQEQRAVATLAAQVGVQW